MPDVIETIESATRLSRRDVLKGIIAFGLLPGSALMALTSCTEEVVGDLLELIANRPTRRNISGLEETDDVVLVYQDAITQMKALPESDKRNWNRQAQIHLNLCPHRNWLTLPWHRHFLFWFEEIVRELTGVDDWAVPYWNWIADPQMPDMFQSGVLSYPRDATSTSIPGAIADYAMSFTTFINFGSGALAPGEPQRPMVSKTESVFEQELHDQVHIDIGNIEDGMASFRSPLDPIFWLHHSMIEYMWVEWNVGRGNSNPSEGHWSGFAFDGDFADGSGADVTGSSSTVDFSRLLPLLAYQYENSLVGTVVGTV